jgi:hypothetical protein
MTTAVAPAAKPATKPAAAAKPPAKGAVAANATPNAGPKPKHVAGPTADAPAPAPVKPLVKRTRTAGRVCFDVQLKFCNQVSEGTTDATPVPDGGAVLKPAALAVRDRLVKWVVAPDKATLTKFLQSSGLEPMTESVREMHAEASETYGPEHGVDVVLGKNAKPTHPKEFDPSEWAAAVVAGAELVYGKKLAFAKDAKADEWKAGKYRIEEKTVDKVQWYYAYVTLTGGTEQSIGEAQTLALATINCLRDASRR